MLDRFTSETFAPHRGETFRVSADSAKTLDVSLTEVTELSGGPGGMASGPTGRVPFSLVFRGPTQPVLSQQIYRVAHGGIGEFDLFLVPIGPDAEGMRYEAIFT